jgi:Protocatechuate 3,4-dioxygenase beta subunit
VSLYLENKHEALQRTVTGENGNFQFTPVLPGKYAVKTTHPTWKLSKDSMNINLLNENVNIPPSSLVVAGYDVSGSVTSDDEPIKGVSFVLFQGPGVCKHRQYNFFNI